MQQDKRWKNGVVTGTYYFFCRQLLKWHHPAVNTSWFCSETRSVSIEDCIHGTRWGTTFFTKFIVSSGFRHCSQDFRTRTAKVYRSDDEHDVQVSCPIWKSKVQPIVPDTTREPRTSRKLLLNTYLRLSMVLRSWISTGRKLGSRIQARQPTKTIESHHLVLLRNQLKAHFSLFFPSKLCFSAYELRVNVSYIVRIKTSIYFLCDPCVSVVNPYKPVPCVWSTFLWLFFSFSMPSWISVIVFFS